MKTFVTVATAVALALGTCLCAAPALAGTKYQTSLVPSAAGTTPGFSASGSSIKLDDKLRLKGKIKNVVDGDGLRVTTDPLSSADDYTIEVDLSVASTASAGTVTIAFDVKKGNGKFAADLSGDAVFTGAAGGDGVAVNAVRVIDSIGTVVGSGGFSVP